MIEVGHDPYLFLLDHRRARFLLGFTDDGALLIDQGGEHVGRLHILRLIEQHPVDSVLLVVIEPGGIDGLDTELARAAHGRERKHHHSEDSHAASLS